MNRALKIVGVTIAVALLLVGGAFVAAYYLLDLNKVVNEQVAQHKPELEKQLGRKVEVGPVSTSILPVLGGKISGITIGADPNHKEDDRPLLQVGQVGFEVALWDALVSMGKRVRIKALYVDGLKVNLLRYPDGTLSYQDILDRQPKEAPKAPEEPAAPMDPRVRELIQNTSIDLIRIGDAEFRLVDHATPTHKVAEDFVKHFNLAIRDVRLSDPIKVHLDAAAFAEARNLDLDVEVGPLPPDLKLAGAPRIGGIKLKATDLDLGKLAPYLGSALPVRIDSVLLSSDYTLGELVPGKPLTVDGFVELKHLQVEGGTVFGLRLDSKLKADLDKLGLEIDKLVLKVGEVALEATGQLHDLATAPSFKNFTLRSTTLDPALLLSYYPPAKKDLPPEFQVSGRGALDLTANGDANRQTLAGVVDLAGLNIRYPGRLLKPAGVPLALRVDGDFSKADANLRKLEVVLDELDIVAKGTVRNFAKPALDLTADAKPFSFDKLARLLPEASDALQKSNAKATGDGSFSAKVKGSTDNLDAALDFGLLGVKLDLPDTHLDGNLTLKALAKGDVSKSLHAEATLDANQAVIRVPKSLNKDAKTPLLVALNVDRTGEQVIVKTFDVKLAELAANAHGSFDLGKGTTNLTVDVAPLDLEKFSRTVTAIPADKAKGGMLDVKVAVAGNPNKLETMSLALDPLNLRYGRSDARGSVKVTNLSKPSAELRINSNLLDVDEMFPPAEKQAEAKKQPGQEPPAKDDPTLKEYTFNGFFDLKRVIARGYDLTNFKGVVKLLNGVLTLEDCTFQTYGGTFSAKGTTAEIWRGKMPYSANLQIKDLDMNQVLTAKSQYKDTLFGKGDLGINLKGVGFETADLERTLTGNMLVALKDGHLGGDSMTAKVLGPVREVLAKVPGLQVQDLPTSNELEDLLAELDVHDGKMNLTKPLAMKLDGAKVALNGAIGIAGDLFLKGNYELAPEVVGRMTGGKCASKDPLPIPLDITGPVKKPAVRPDAMGAGQSLAKACLEGGLLGSVGNVLKDKLGVQVPTSKAEAEKKAREEADKAKADAQAKAKAEADRLKAEADKKRADAEAAARAEADRKKHEAEDRAKAEADKQRKAAEDAAKQKAQDALKKFPGFP